MNQIRYILAAIALVSTLQLSAQEKDSEPRIAPDGRQLLLTSKDKDFLQLWFYERMLEMSLDPQGREDYSGKRRQAAAGRQGCRDRGHAGTASA